MKRLTFIWKLITALWVASLGGMRDAHAEEDDDFTMSGGALIGEAGGVHGA